MDRGQGHQCQFCCCGTVGYHNNRSLQGSSPLLARTTNYAALSCIHGINQHQSSVINQESPHHSPGVMAEGVHSPGVRSAAVQADIIAFNHFAQRPLFKKFVILQNAEKARFARLHSFSEGFVRQLVAVSTATGKAKGGEGSHRATICEVTSAMRRSDIIHHDHAGWMYEVGSGLRRWCLLVDILLCVFAQKDDEAPLHVIIISRSRTARILCNSAKRAQRSSSEAKFKSRLPGSSLPSILKYQFLIEDVFTNKEHAFSTETELMLEEWMLMLKLASNLGSDFAGEQPDVDNDSVDVQVDRGPQDTPAEEFSFVSPHKSRCLPRSRLLCHISRTDSTDRNNNNVSRKKVKRKKPRHSSNSEVSSISRYHGYQGNETGTDSSTNRLTRPSSTSCLPTATKHPSIEKLCGPFVKSDVSGLYLETGSDGNRSGVKQNPPQLYRKGSLEKLRVLLRKKSNVRSLSIQDTDGYDFNSKRHSNSTCSPVTMVTHCVTEEGQPCVISLPRSVTDYSGLNTYSTSVDYSSSHRSGLAQKLAQKASNIRHKIHHMYRSRGSSDGHMTLSMLVDCKLEGSLHRKHVLKWSSVWCVVAGGCFYEFRNNDDKEIPGLSLSLNDCSLSMTDREKHGRSYVFKLTHHQSRSLYYHSEDAATFAAWVNTLIEETSTYESFQSSPRAVTLDGQRLSDWASMSLEVTQGQGHTQQPSIDQTQSELVDRTLFSHHNQAATSKASEKHPFLNSHMESDMDRSTPHMMCVDPRGTPLLETPSQNRTTPLPELSLVQTTSHTQDALSHGHHRDSCMSTDSHLLDDAVHTLDKEALKAHDTLQESLSGSYLSRHPTVSKCCAWTLENYFQQHYMNQATSTQSEVDSADSQSTVTESVLSVPDATTHSELLASERFPNQTFNITKYSEGPDDSRQKNLSCYSASHNNSRQNVSSIGNKPCSSMVIKVPTPKTGKSISFCSSVLKNAYTPRAGHGFLFGQSKFSTSQDVSGIFYTTQDMNSTIFNQHLSGPNNDGLMMIDETMETDNEALQSIAQNYSNESSVFTDTSVLDGYHGNQQRVNHTYVISPQVAAHDVDGRSPHVRQIGRRSLDSAVRAQQEAAQFLKPTVFSRLQAELQKIRRRSLSDNNLTASKTSPSTSRPKFRRTLSLKKRKKGVAVRKVAPLEIPANYLEGAQTQGYVEKCQKGQEWERMWCVLKSGTLYVYGTPEDDAALDTLELSLCSFKQYVEGYKHRRHVVEILQEPYSPEFIAMETQEDMAIWLNHLKTAVMEASVDTVTPARTSVSTVTNPDTSQASTNIESSVLPSSEWDEIYHNNEDDAFVSRGLEAAGVFDDSNTPNSPDSMQREVILQKKQLLLQEVLLQKQQLQTTQGKSTCKDVEDELSRYQQQYSPMSDMSPRSPDITMETALSPLQDNHEDERRWKELIILKQRKMSTELKVDSLQRIIHSCNPKPQKKPRLRLPLMKKSSSQENLCAPEGAAPEEINHWFVQLQILKNELEELTGEITEREQRHTWYSGHRTAPDDPSRSEPRSVSLLSERGLLRHGIVGAEQRKQSSSSAKSDGCIDEDRPARRSDGYRPRADNKTRLYAQSSNSSVGTNTDSRRVLYAQNSNSSVGTNPDSKRPLCAQVSNSSVGTTASFTSTQYDSSSPVMSGKQGNARPSRINKITALGKKLPTVKRGFMQKSRSQDHEMGSPILQNHNDRRSSYDIGQRSTGKKQHKRASLDERIVIGGQSKTPTINRKVVEEPAAKVKALLRLEQEPFQVVPPNSRRSSDGSEVETQPGAHLPENMPSPGTAQYGKADSLLTSVMQALDSINKSPQQGVTEPPRARAASMSSNKVRLSAQNSASNGRASIDSPVFINNQSSLFSPRSDQSGCTCASLLTEHSLDTDSGRGSPLTPDIPFSADKTSPESVNRSAACPRGKADGGTTGGSCERHGASADQPPAVPGESVSPEANPDTHRPLVSPQRSSEGAPPGSITTKALANIAAFEQLIQEKLGFY